MEVRAVAKYVRISPQKVRRMIGTVKGQPVEKALEKLKFMPLKAAEIVDNVDSANSIRMDDTLRSHCLAIVHSPTFPGQR